MVISEGAISSAIIKIAGAGSVKLSYSTYIIVDSATIRVCAQVPFVEGLFGAPKSQDLHADMTAIIKNVSFTMHIRDFKVSAYTNTCVFCP